MKKDGTFYAQWGNKKDVLSIMSQAWEKKKALF